MIKLGFGFYYHMLNDKHFAFAQQCGATHAVIHLVDYQYQGEKSEKSKRFQQPKGDESGWGIAGKNLPLWNTKYLNEIKSKLSDHGLELLAVENFDPSDWFDVLLDGPRRNEQIKTIKKHINTLGEVGIPIMGYNFSIAGVTSRIEGSFARGGAKSVGMNTVNNAPLPNGLVWNMRVNNTGEGFILSATEMQLWDRWRRFIDDILPEAESAGVILAAHPDDPPVKYLRQQPRLGWNIQAYESILEYKKSEFNKLELCLGTIAEMPEHDIYASIERIAQKKGIAYIHFRNVVGHAPNYREVFIDEGQVDMKRILQILNKENYDGVLIPDHAPEMTCDAPWHAGMAYAMGYIRSLLTN